MTTGPDERRDRYVVSNPREFRSGGIGALYRGRLRTDFRGVEAGTEVGLKMLLAVDPARFAKLQRRNTLVPRHPRLALHLESFSGPPLISGVWDDGDLVYYTSHVWVDGDPLSERLVDASIDDFWRWSDDLATAIDVLHAQPDGGLAHRDIHAGNVIITPDSRAVLIDFDAMLAGEPHDTSITTLISFGVGGAGEGLQGWKAADRSSAARILLRVLAGDADPDTAPTTLRDAASERLRGPSTRPDRLARHLVRAIADPPESVAALVEGLRRTQRQRVSRPSRPVLAGAALLAAAAVVAVAALGVVASHRHDGHPTDDAATDRPERTYAETPGSAVHTWASYADAVTGPGPILADRTTVQVSCRIRGYRVKDGNVWWYRFSSAPWSDHYYGSADAFYNNGRRSGSLIGTPYVDERVPIC